MRKGWIAAVSGIVGLASAATANAALVAQWDFNAATSAAGLVDSVGGYTLAPRAVGTGQTFTYNGDGTVSLGAGEQLFTTGLNSSVDSTLLSNATIYLRMRFDSGGGTAGAFASFVNGTGVATSYLDATNGTSLSGLTAGATTGAVYGKTDAGATIAPGSGFPTYATGQYYNVAVVFNDLTDLNGAASTTKSSATLYINGVAVTRDGTGLKMPAFASFAIGRAVAGGSPGATSYDLVQVYDEALSASQIAAIPEPASLAALGLMGAALLRRRRA